MSELVVGLLLIVGGVFGVIGAFGLLRMPDVLIRMHAATKIGTLTSGLILAGVAIWFWEPSITARVVLVVVFLLLTAPIASHMIGRAAVSLGVPLFKGEPAPEQKD